MKVAAKGKSRKGTPYVIRYIETKDARPLCDYINQLSQEKTYVTFQGHRVTLAEERKTVAGQIKALRAKKGFMLLLTINGKIAGVCNAQDTGRGREHVATFGLSLAASARGQGLGEKLLRTLLAEIAKKMPQIKTVTLTVMAPNKVAQALYKKLGFKKYGNLPKGSTYRGKHVDEIYMYRRVAHR